MKGGGDVKSLEMYQQIQGMIEDLQSQLNDEMKAAYSVPEIREPVQAESRVKCYSKKELEEIFQCSHVPIDGWIQEGLIRGIKSGNTLVFPVFEIIRFQRAMLGKDISNKVKAMNVARSLK